MKTLTLLLAMAFLFSGCATTIEGKRCDPQGNCVGFKVKTHNEYPEGYKAKLNTQTGDFEIEVGAAVAKPNPLEKIGAEVINRFFEQFMPENPQ